MTLSATTVSTIYKSSSIIERHSNEIAQTMYIMLFDLYPSYKEFFKNGPSNQHKLLSEVISSYAVNVDKIDVLMPGLQKIAVTHVRAGVQEEHYKVIIRMMLLAMKVVLHEKVEPEVIVAWRKGLIFVSSVLIDLEKKLYKENLSS